MAWHFGSSTCYTVRSDEKRGIVTKCFGHGEKWLVQMSPWLVYLLGYQAVLAHLTKDGCVCETGHSYDCLLVSVTVEKTLTIK